MGTSKMKAMLALLAIAPIGTCMAGCAGASKAISPVSSSAGTTSTPAAASSREQTKLPSSDRDNDADATGNGRYDSDDYSVIDLGHPANGADRTEITTLIRRYYAAAASEDGAKACSMLYSIYAEAAPEDYGTSPPGPAYAHGTTCPAVLTAIFNHFHDQIAVKLPKLKVLRIRIEGRRGIVVLSFGAMPERQMSIFREGRTWKMLAFVDGELP
jgi:hypothetical protein